jgi:hypothetical protein
MGVGGDEDAKMTDPTYAYIIVGDGEWRRAK